MNFSEIWDSFSHGASLATAPAAPQLLSTAGTSEVLLRPAKEAHQDGKWKLSTTRFIPHLQNYWCASTSSE